MARGGADNLHRNDLTKLERLDQTAEWISLARDEYGEEEEGVEEVAQLAPLPLGRGFEGGLRAAARESGIERTDAQRAEQVARLTPEARSVAVTAGLDDNPFAPMTISLTMLGNVHNVWPNERSAKRYEPAMTEKFVTYRRVSTVRQGASGLGLEAQKAAVDAFLSFRGARVVGDFVEVESGGNAKRPEIAKAFAACKLYGARLVIAKLDRLSRDDVFLNDLKRAGIRFVCCDNPEANELTIDILIAVAKNERKMISERTRVALAAAKARGQKLGGMRVNTVAPTAEHAAASLVVRRSRATDRAAGIGPIIATLRAEGVTSLAGIAKALTEHEIPTSRGLTTWAPAQVARVLAALPA